jgi:hypothetical protein
MSRNGIALGRRRNPNASRDSSPVRGVMINWQTDELEVQRLINQYFDATDQRQLLREQDIGYTAEVNN